jgi:predicted DNA-binding protein YlxM (UPF0122 family)
MVTSARKSAAEKVVPKKSRVDWDAVERDYRTAKFTLRELAAKFGVSHQAIATRAKKRAWTQDLSLAIKQATNARLVDELVAKEIDKNGQAVASTVLAAAELNSRIIQGHRTRLAALHGAVEKAKKKLMALGDSVADIREAATFVQAVGNLATATKTLIEQERKAHNLDADDPDPETEKKRVLVEFVEADKP